MKPLALTLLLGLAACGYRPPPATDTANPGYVAARDACQSSATTAVDRSNAKTGLAWMSSPVTRWGEIGDATSSCMDGKGFGRLRWCTPAELRSGTRPNAAMSGMVVTASGVQCSDPPTDPSTHPADTSPPASAPKAKAGKRSPG